LPGKVHSIKLIPGTRGGGNLRVSIIHDMARLTKVEPSADAAFYCDHKGGTNHMPVRKLKEFLDNHRIKYTIIKHSPAFTAQEIAASAHISGRELAKTVMVRIDGKMAMAVLPASCRVDLDLLREASQAHSVTLAEEEEFKDMFPECDIGAMPPFGNLYGIEVFASEKLAQDEEIAFNAGEYTELIKMSFSDFQQMVKPKIARFSC
jgi:Ala-tRNA(Pro) deacylase